MAWYTYLPDVKRELQVCKLKLDILEELRQISYLLTHLPSRLAGLKTDNEEIKMKFKQLQT